MIVAYDQSYGIGVDGDLPWGRDLPADLAHFRRLTIGKSIVMGRKTFDSIGRPLADRENIVVSRDALNVPDVVTVKSLEEAYRIASHEVCVIGGASIYSQALGDIDTVYATEVHYTFSLADTFFPVLDSDIWRETARDHHKKDDKNLYDYDFVTYSRIDT